MWVQARPAMSNRYAWMSNRYAWMEQLLTKRSADMAAQFVQKSMFVLVDRMKGVKVYFGPKNYGGDFRRTMAQGKCMKM